ncbi:kinesin-like protein Klp8 [Clydaea vesicula]|uniref:Kinesin-like protein Klp8 n=1 Tax=Clydaea vesicula TaxID=447962 RepID=A0AAD5XY48_9FUNG|nr:kinesin-like protein Klp8 [Clydaea vesicula]
MTKYDITLINPKAKETKHFCFDRCFNSSNKSDANFYTNQETLYDEVGKEVLDHSFQGFNTCLFAYGQTGSGKSYTMMGTENDVGVIPRFCKDLFKKIENFKTADLNHSFSVSASYMEIYNEKVIDLLNPFPNNKKKLRIREHPNFGPYVEDLSKVLVNSHSEITLLIENGNKSRTIATTNMNQNSSRSHTIFTIVLLHHYDNKETGMLSEKQSRICLVDLAGSERTNLTGSTGIRFKEGTNINKSLTTLGKVINNLTEDKNSGKKSHIPYRDSVLTWLLKDNLGGNSKTVMLASISPAAIHYDETISTLRYAERAKRIINKAVVNEDPNIRMVRELKEEVNRLKEVISSFTAPPADRSALELELAGISLDEVSMLRDQLNTSEKLMKELLLSYEEKLEQTKVLKREREIALHNAGVTSIGFLSTLHLPHLVNLNEDPLLSECLVYNVGEGVTNVVHVQSDNASSFIENRIEISGEYIMPLHCFFQSIKFDCEPPQYSVSLVPTKDALVFVNGVLITEATPLYHGDRIILGDHHVYRFVQPNAASNKFRRDSIISQSATQNSGTSSTNSYYSDTSSNKRIIDWNYAVEELNKVNMESGNIERFFKSPRRSLFSDDDVSSICTSTYDSVIDDTIFIDNDCFPNSFQQDCEATSPIFSSPNVFSQKTLRSRRSMLQINNRSQINRKLSFLSLDADANITDCSTDRFLQNLERKAHIKRLILSQIHSNFYDYLVETILSFLPLLKEANVIALEGKKKVVYNFCIVHRSMAYNFVEGSFWDGKKELERRFFPNFSDVPQVKVKVFDARHNSLYYWSLSTFKEKVQVMRQVFNAEPNKVDDNLNFCEIFYESVQNRPSFQPIGFSKLFKFNLFAHIPREGKLPVFEANGAEVLGYIRILLNPVPFSKSISNSKCVDSRCYEISIIELNGISENFFTQVHVQFKYFNQKSKKMEFCSTDLTKNFGNKTIKFDFFKVVSLVDEDIVFEIFGKPIKLVENVIEQELLNPDLISERSMSFSAETFDLSDNCKLDFQKHDVLVQMSILELSADSGKFNCIPYKISEKSGDDGEFFLKQGVQRRISVKLSHVSGREFPWRCVKSISLGNIRTVPNSKKNEVTRSNLPNLNKSAESMDNLISLKVPTQQIIESQRNGNTSIQVTLPWDSSLHENINLNRITATGEKIYIDIFIEADLEPLPPYSSSSDDNDNKKSREVGPVKFNFCFGVNVISRNSKINTNLHSSKLFTFLNSFGAPTNSLTRPRYKNVKSLIFAVFVKLKKNKSKLDLNKGYVRGEEILHGWPKFPLEIIEEYFLVKKKLTKKFQVEETKQYLQFKEFDDVDKCNTTAKNGEGYVDDGKKKINDVLLKDTSFLPGFNAQIEVLKNYECVENYPSCRDISDFSLRDTKSKTTAEDQINEIDLNAKNANIFAKRSDLILVKKVFELWNKESKQNIFNFCSANATGNQDVKAPVWEIKSQKIELSSNLICGSGWLNTPLGEQEESFDEKKKESATERWIKRYCVLQRPYFHIYESSDQVNGQLLSIPLSEVTVQFSIELWKTLQRPYTFALYTTSPGFSTIFQAASEQDMFFWISIIDPLYYSAMISSKNNKIKNS